MEETNGQVERILQKGRVVQREVRELKDEIGAAAREVRDKFDITDAVRRHPVRAVALGLAAGYVLGGGLCARATRGMFGFGARTLLLPIAKAQLLALLAGAGAGAAAGKAISDSDS